MSTRLEYIITLFACCLAFLKHFLFQNSILKITIIRIAKTQNFLILWSLSHPAGRAINPSFSFPLEIFHAEAPVGLYNA